MRIALVILITIFWFQTSAQWTPFSPEGIQTNVIEFYVDNNNNWAVGANGGTYYYHLNTQTWSHYWAILPVIDVSWLDGINTLVVMYGGGVIPEEGVHVLDPGSGTHYPLQYLETPHFVEHDITSGRSFVGYRSGIRYTDNISDWYSLEYFNNMDIVDMVIYEDHFVVSRIDNLMEVHYSGDGGSSWTLSAGAPMISEMVFDPGGKLYGICPGTSYSSGLYSSDDYGATWSVEFYQINIQCVGTDAMGSVFIGFGEDTLSSNEGIARWDADDQQLYPMNAGLTSLSINQITYNPGMSAMALFCCTDSGVFVNYNYVNISEEILPSQTLKLWPNPAQHYLNIQHAVIEDAEISIYSANGQLIDHFNNPDSSGQFKYNCSFLEQGIYYLVIDNGHERLSRKWIKI